MNEGTPRGFTPQGIVGKSPFVAPAALPKKEVVIASSLELAETGAGPFSVDVTSYYPWGNGCFKASTVAAKLRLPPNILAREGEVGSHASGVELMFLAARELLPPGQIVDLSRAYVQYANSVADGGFVLPIALWAFIMTCDSLDRETIDVTEWSRASEVLAMARRSDGKRLEKWNDAILETSNIADSMVALHFDSDNPFDRYSKQPILLRDAPLVLNCAFSGCFPFWQAPVLTVAVTTPVQAFYISSLFQSKKLSAVCRPDAPSYTSLKTLMVPLRQSLHAASSLAEFVVDRVKEPQAES